ncbi:hypothetical protein HK105_206464 [Polyrhizophydium stewartii]|uniref:NmrA-like domain-containing protein n=1 Tax=Polyrhizophydium stewartii TaxID=2732419 RepID=A0ABR4N3F3_9FUNG
MTGKIFVLGATGKVGQPLLRALAARDAAVTAFVRNPAKVETLPGVTAVKGDVKDTAAFAAAVQGHERLFLLISDPADVTIEPALAAAAAAAGVKHIVKMSALDASDNDEVGSIQYLHGVAEKAVMAAVPGVALTILRPGYFLQNLFSRASEIKFSGSLATCMGGAQMAHIDAADIAEVAAVILTSPADEYSGMSLTLTGPQARSWDDVAAAMAKEFGRPMRINHLDPAAYIRFLTGVGMPRKMAWMLAQVETLSRRNYTGNSFATGNVEFVTGRKPRTVEQFLAEHHDAFV